MSLAGSLVFGNFSVCFKQMFTQLEMWWLNAQFLIKGLFIYHTQTLTEQNNFMNMNLVLWRQEPEVAPRFYDGNLTNKIYCFRFRSGVTVWRALFKTAERNAGRSSRRTARNFSFTVTVIVLCNTTGTRSVRCIQLHICLFVVFEFLLVSLRNGVFYFTRRRLIQKRVCPWDRPPWLFDLTLFISHKQTSMETNGLIVRLCFD